MAHLNLLATVKLPVSADGDLIKDAEGTVIAKTGSIWIAVALADLANLGREPAEKLNEKYEEQEAAKYRMFSGSLGR